MPIIQIIPDQGKRKQRKLDWKGFQKSFKMFAASCYLATEAILLKRWMFLKAEILVWQKIKDFAIEKQPLPVKM